MVKSEPIIYVIGGIIAATIIAMSVFFILKSVKRAKKIGMDMSKIKKAISFHFVKNKMRKAGLKTTE